MVERVGNPIESDLLAGLVSLTLRHVASICVVVRFSLDKLVVSTALAVLERWAVITAIVIDTKDYLFRLLGSRQALII